MPAQTVRRRVEMPLRLEFLLSKIKTIEFQVKQHTPLDPSSDPNAQVLEFTEAPNIQSDKTPRKLRISSGYSLEVTDEQEEHEYRMHQLTEIGREVDEASEDVDIACARWIVEEEADEDIKRVHVDGIMQFCLLERADYIENVIVRKESR